jgi:hypothetical protein
MLRCLLVIQKQESLSAMTQPKPDRFADGTRSIVSVLRPSSEGWTEIPGAHRFSFGFPARSYLHKDGLFAISAVEVATDKDGIDRGFEYHISISRPVAPGITSRCTSNEAKWVLDQFGLDGAEEDNHVPNGRVRNFWRTVATGLIGLECACKKEEPAIREDKGDFVWRP